METKKLVVDLTKKSATNFFYNLFLINFILHIFKNMDEI